MFVSSWIGNKITLPITPIKSTMIHWGDGVINNNLTHIYKDNKNRHIIKIEGIFTFGFGIYHQYSKNLLEIINWGGLVLSNDGYQFANTSNLVILTTDEIIGPTNMTGIFYNSCINKLPPINTKFTLKLDYAFYNSKIKGYFTWDLTNVNSMEYMLCKTEYNNIVYFQAPCLRYAKGLFKDCNKFNKNVTIIGDMLEDSSEMFMYCTKFNSNIIITSNNLRNINFMFEGAWFFNKPLNNINLNNIQNMNNTFKNASSFNQPIESKSKIKELDSTFEYAYAFNSPLILDVSEVLTMRKLFHGCINFNKDIVWYCPMVHNMAYMFCDCKSLNSVIKLYTKNIYTTKGMFHGCINLNKDIFLLWNTDNLTNMNSMFSYCTNFNSTLYINNTKNVIDFCNLFYNCPNYNKFICFDISSIPYVYNIGIYMSLNNGMNVVEYYDNNTRSRYVNVIQKKTIFPIIEE
jgi:hypothetical protein